MNKLYKFSIIFIFTFLFVTIIWYLVNKLAEIPNPYPSGLTHLQASCIIGLIYALIIGFFFFVLNKK